VLHYWCCSSMSRGVNLIPYVVILLRTLTAPHDTGYTEHGTGNTKRYIDAQYRRLTDDSRHVACTQSPTG